MCQTPDLSTGFGQRGFGPSGSAGDLNLTVSGHPLSLTRPRKHTHTLFRARALSAAARPLGGTNEVPFYHKFSCRTKYIRTGTR